MKTVLISGGSKGLGGAMVEAFLKHGDYVVSTFSRSVTPFVEKMTKEYPDRFFFSQVDISNSERLTEYFCNLRQKLGGVDILINNAAIATDGLVALTSDDDLDKMLSVNLRGTILLTRACVREMLRNKWGRIINISSIVGQHGYRGLSVYSATKSGLDGFTRSLARELGELGITVNSIAPGFLETEMTHGLSEKQRNQIIKRTPLKRLGVAGDVTPLVLFLSSDAAQFITGQVITVDGGIAV